MRYLFSLLLALMLAVPAYAAFDGPGGGAGGFQGPTSGVQADTVKRP